MNEKWKKILKISLFILAGCIVAYLLFFAGFGDGSLAGFIPLGTGVGGGLLGFLAKRLGSLGGSRSNNGGDTADRLDSVDKRLTEIDGIARIAIKRIAEVEQNLLGRIAESESVAGRLKENLASGKYVVRDSDGNIIDLSGVHNNPGNSGP